jgi:cell division septum initiation protein DivIVA
MQLTGLEDPEELWERLKEATAEAQALAVTNKKLAGRVKVLERQLSEVGGLSDDELVAELPKRMARALDSAQAVANEIVGRARKQEAAIRQQAKDSAADILRQAEERAATMLSDAATQATAHIVSAEGKAQEIIRSAHARRQHVLAEIEGEARAVQRRMEGLERNRSRLLEAVGVVERTLGEARRALNDAGEEREVRPPAPRAEENGDQAAGTVTRARPRRTAPSLTVYDWSPAASTAG